MRLGFNDLLYFIEQENQTHEDPLPHNHPNWIGSKFNMTIKWENGEVRLSHQL